MAAQVEVEDGIEVLEDIERRVRFIAMAMIDHANRVRPNPSRIKVGGHQASSASMSSILTALYFDHLAAPDQVSVKPHAAPVLHAINYVLGRLDASYLTRLRELGGLQPYPSRTKDPDVIDYSTGSVGIGATATLWRAIAHRYVAGHFPVPRGGRQIALLGDAELDEGAIWEAVVDPMVRELGEVMWIVDVNRQSLDRVVPGIAAGRLAAMFEAAGWHTQTLKWGRQLTALYAREGGDHLRARIEDMSNEEYQRLLRADAADVRERLLGSGPDRAVAATVADLDDATLHTAIRDLGGHDIAALREAMRTADAHADRPSVIFAYTIKAHALPTEGHPSNHSALLTEEQMRLLAEQSGCDLDDPWRTAAPGPPEALCCAETAERLRRTPVERKAPPAVPVDLGRGHAGETSTQQALGRIVLDIAHDAPEVASCIVTASPDVASSTNLAGWVSRRGVWFIGERIDWFGDDAGTLMRWREHEHGQHVALGIAEVNLVGLLGELGATWSRDGQPLLPIGTLYDPFVSRALEPWSFGIYAGGQSILIGTPSGISLAPEGGAHQSISTPSIGLEQPGCVAYEPAFGQDLEWTFLHALGQLGRPDGQSAYFRLTTRPVDQALAALPDDPAARERRRALAVAGGYRLREAPGRPDVVLVGVGAVMPEVLAAAETLAAGGLYAVDVICLTSPDLVFRALLARQGTRGGDASILDELFPADRAAPLVTVLDGHPHTLAFLGAVRGARLSALGTTAFGQAGAIDDLYRDAGIDAETIVGAALDVIDG